MNKLIQKARNIYIYIYTATRLTRILEWKEEVVKRLSSFIFWRGGASL